MKDRPPGIVMVLPAYLPESLGGAEHQSQRLSQALSLRGARVTLLAPRLESSSPAREREGAVEVRRFRARVAPNLGGRHFGSFLRWSLCIVVWLMRHRREFDVIHVIHGRLHAVPATLAGRWLGKPVVVKPGRGGDTHFDLSLVRRKRLFGPLYARAILRGTTAWVANSQTIAADLERLVPRDRIHPIPNGVVVQPETAPQTMTGTVQCVSMGRLDPEKAVDQTIRAFANLLEDTEVRLTILGDGRCRDELEALARSLGQAPRIGFSGAVTDVSPYLTCADIYLSSSESEGMSNALLEAMAHGVMPVVSRVSGVADLVEDGLSGFLFPPGDESALATRLREAVELTPARRRKIGEAARAVVSAKFSMDRVAEEHLALYRGLTELRDA